MAIRFVCSLSE